MADSPDIHELLRRHWGYHVFRPLQENIVQSLLAGRDVAVVMPTGGGKSLCYQLPALALGRTAVVISPLIALMQDQAAQLAEMDIPAAALNSTMSVREQHEVMRAARAGAFRVLYLSPERLARQDSAGWLSEVPKALFAIDEAHCISEWGHEFRPEYRQLSSLRTNFPGTPIAAFTASATKRVRHDILQQLQLREPDKYIFSFRRPNLRYLVRECKGESQDRLLGAALRAHWGQSAIVYAPTIASVESTAAWLMERGIPAVPYHARMDAKSRRNNQEMWMADEVGVLVGTIAFGLGINKPAVRLVVRLSLPKSLEQFYQEAGRAGRDGLPSDCAMLWQRKDTGLLAHFNSQISDPAEQRRSWERYRTLLRFVESPVCRHRQICLHFGQTPRWTTCGMCDICAPDEPDWLSAPERVVEPIKPVRAEQPVDEALLDRLRRWRRETAARNQVPAYVVLHDSSLADLCQKRPRRREDLLTIFGIGRRKAAAYGDEILAIIASATLE